MIGAMRQEVSGESCVRVEMCCAGIKGYQSHSDFAGALDTVGTVRFPECACGNGRQQYVV